MKPTKPTKIETILLIDDDDDLRMLARVALESLAGYAVLDAADGEAGIARARSQLPDLILLDGMMPGLDGPATLLRLRADAATAAVPVIFLTARTRPDEIARFLSLGALGVIEKPFDPLRLADSVQRVLAEAGR